MVVIGLVFVILVIRFRVFFLVIDFGDSFWEKLVGLFLIWGIRVVIKLEKFYVLYLLIN